MDLGWGERYRVGTNLKWTPDDTQHQALPPADKLQREMDAEIAAAFPRNRKSRLYGTHGKKLTVKQAKTAKFKERVLANRIARIDSAWRQRLRGAKSYLPPELQVEGTQEALEARMQDVPVQGLAAKARRSLQGRHNHRTTSGHA